MTPSEDSWVESVLLGTGNSAHALTPRGAELSEAERNSEAEWKAKRERTPRVAADMREQLQPCPFCHGSAKFGYSYDLEDDGTVYNGCWVECEGCSCEMGRLFPDTMENDSGAFDTFEEAIVAWNRRS